MFRFQPCENDNFGHSRWGNGGKFGKVRSVFQIHVVSLLPCGVMLLQLVPVQVRERGRRIVGGASTCLGDSFNVFAKPVSGPLRHHLRCRSFGIYPLRGRVRLEFHINMSFPYMLVAEETKVLYVGMPQSSSTALQTTGVSHPLYMHRWGLRTTVEEASKINRRQPRCSCLPSWFVKLATVVMLLTTFSKSLLFWQHHTFSKSFYSTRDPGSSRTALLTPRGGPWFNKALSWIRMTSELIGWLSLPWDGSLWRQLGWGLFCIGVSWSSPDFGVDVL